MKRLLCLFLLIAPPLQAEVPKVAVDIVPVHSIVASVMQGMGEPALIIPPTASPHSYAMRPSEARALSGADLVVWVGPALTPWLQEPLDTLAGSAARLALLEAEGVPLLELREDVAFDADAHDHDHGHDHGHADGHAEDEHKPDPHAWLDPAVGAIWASAIAEQLSAMDPENAAGYRANAAALSAEAAAFQTEWQARLDPVHDVQFIVFHDAFQYFERRFDLHATAAIQTGEAAAPGASRIQALKETLSQSNLRCAFAEPQFNPKLITTVTEGLNVEAAILDPLGSDVPMGPGHYLATLDALARAMADCLGR